MGWPRGSFGRRRAVRSVRDGARCLETVRSSSSCSVIFFALQAPLVVKTRNSKQDRGTENMTELQHTLRSTVGAWSLEMVLSSVSLHVHSKIGRAHV